MFCFCNRWNLLPTKLITQVLVISLISFLFSETKSQLIAIICVFFFFLVLVCEDLFISFLSSMPHLFTLRKLNKSVSFGCIGVITGTIILISYFYFSDIFFYFKRCTVIGYFLRTWCDS